MNILEFVQKWSQARLELRDQVFQGHGLFLLVERRLGASEVLASRLFSHLFLLLPAGLQPLARGNLRLALRDLPLALGDLPLVLGDFWLALEGETLALAGERQVFEGETQNSAGGSADQGGEPEIRRGRPQRKLGLRVKSIANSGE